MPEVTLDSLIEAWNEDVSASEPDDESAQPDVEAQKIEDDSDHKRQVETDDDDPEAAEEVEESDDEQPEGDFSDDRVVKWKAADGTEYAHTEKELQDGFMCARDYTHKLQELATEKEKAESEIQQRAQTQIQVMNAYGSKLGELHAVNAQLERLESSARSINREDDPAQYAALHADLNALLRHRDGLSQVLGQANQLMQAQQADAIQKQLQETTQVLSAEFPDLKERVKAWNSHATDTYGFTPQELGAVVDPRIFRLLDDAVKYRELQARKPEAVQKVKAAPVKVAKQTRSVPPSSIDKARKSFEANPNLGDMATLWNAKK